MARKIWGRSMLKSFIRQFTCETQNRYKTAGIVVIGDEILKGEVPDTNSSFLAAGLYQLGIRLKKISVIGDEIQEIATEVRHFSKTYDYVITTGGIGPTHDDVTYEAVALAFNEPLVVNQELLKLCMDFYRTTDVNIPAKKLARIPKSAKLNRSATNKLKFPNVSVGNVYIFPGIPEFLKKSFNGLKDELFTSSKKFYSKSLYLATTEDKIAKILNTVVEEYSYVQFGSYPKMFEETYKVKLTIESCSEESTREAYKRLLQLIPKEFIVNREDP